MARHRYYVVAMDEQWAVKAGDDHCIPCATQDEAVCTAKRVAKQHHRSGDLSEIIVPDQHGYPRTAWSYG
ncbi:DUF2188 domain-containing protein [Chthonobacter rhizosphaerae]|uniref:DUF2188 domain-containing protein n=1 Tax=Chthonobacter rhizosphaerae TaxID=2735553 RepID=UPI0015EFB6C6|nr:DUF2188 domain-containing protein [Chthonobacter rhizosphaerae]